MVRMCCSAGEDLHVSRISQVRRPGYNSVSTANFPIADQGCCSPPLQRRDFDSRVEISVLVFRQKNRVVKPSGGHASGERANPIYAVVGPVIGGKGGS